MSVPVKGNELHKKGKELPLLTKRRELARHYAEAVAEALKEELQCGASIKAVMNWTGASERTVKGWLAGSSGPRGEYLVVLLRSSDLVFQRVLALASRGPVIVDRNRLASLREHLDRLAAAIEATLV